MDWRERNGVPWLEAELPAARAIFSTRQGGVSTAEFASLNLGWITGDDRDSTYENRRRIAAAAEIEPANVVCGFQVHGAEVMRHHKPTTGVPYLHPPESPPEVDGHATAVVGLAPLVVVADCLPVALSGPDGVAMLHCGWRGLAAGIIGAGVRETTATAAAIGPGIGPCCFEVGDEVLAEFEYLGDGVAEGRMLDLAEVARRQLVAAGVRAIDRAGFCTSCHEELFFSHRRDGGKTGRQAGMVLRTSRLSGGGARLRPSDSASLWPS